MGCELLKFFRDELNIIHDHDGINNEKDENIEILNEKCKKLHKQIKSPTDPAIHAFRDTALLAAYQCFLIKNYNDIIRYLDWIFIVTGEKFYDIIDLLEGKERSLLSSCIFPKDEEGRESISLSESIISSLYQQHPQQLVKRSFSSILPKWNPLTILEVGAHRLVPVEIGSSYLESSWYQELMTIEDYFQRFVIEQDVINIVKKEDYQKNSHSVIGYIAQHDLLCQIPSLALDMYAFERILKEEIRHHSSVLTRNCWIGMQGTTTPFHRDEYENIFVQIYGQKEIFLIDKDYKLPMVDDNTSNLDPRNINDMNIPIKRIVIEAGEVMSIKKGEWHYIKSLTFSISISYWWNDMEK